MPLMPVAEALKLILNGVTPLPEESVVLDDALGRTLARDIVSKRDQPPQAMSAMDGYAVRAADIATIPAKLKVIGEVAAGRPFSSPVNTGDAVRIFTGGVVPDGADTVVIQEDTTRDGHVVILNETTAPGKNIRVAGLDFRTGDLGLKRGTHLIDRDLSLAAGMNHPHLAVHRRPKVALLATGDELVLPGETLGPGEIVCSNGFALRALARSEGADVIDLGIARDTIDATTAAIRKAREAKADILVTTGGASVGEHDMVKRALEAEGIEIAFWRIAMRPGKPMMHGRDAAMRALGLPGNPSSSYVCAFLFLVPLIRALSGRNDIYHRTETALLATPLGANDQRQDYLRAELTTRDDGVLVATPVALQDSSLLRHLSRADALIVRAPHAPAAEPDSRCQVLRLSG